MGNTMAGGVNGDFSNIGYHSISASPCRYPPSIPMAKVITTGMA